MNERFEKSRGRIFKTYNKYVSTVPPFYFKLTLRRSGHVDVSSYGPPLDGLITCCTAEEVPF